MFRTNLDLVSQRWPSEALTGHTCVLKPVLTISFDESWGELQILSLP